MLVAALEGRVLRDQRGRQYRWLAGRMLLLASNWLPGGLGSAWDGLDVTQASPAGLVMVDAWGRHWTAGRGGEMVYADIGGCAGQESLELWL